MNRNAAIGVAAIAVIAVSIWAVSTGKADPIIDAVAPQLNRKPVTVAAKLPPCGPINPDVAPPLGCIPQYLANLPPDPGEAGKLTIEGIDSDGDGVRDDVQRYIAQRYGESERAVKALHLIAKSAQTQVTLGDSVSRDEAYEIAKKMTPAARCYFFTVGQGAIEGRALESVTAEVTNTPERFERWLKFERLTVNRIYLMSEAELPEACGYDPEKLPN